AGGSPTWSPLRLANRKGGRGGPSGAGGPSGGAARRPARSLGRSAPSGRRSAPPGNAPDNGGRSAVPGSPPPGKARVRLLGVTGGSAGSLLGKLRLNPAERRSTTGKLPDGVSSAP